MKTIEQLIDDVIAREGGYADHPADRGGPTRFGITQATARAAGYAGDMLFFPIDLARQIYRRTYWTRPHIDAVAPLAPRIAAELFDTAINCGVATAIMLLQRALNTFVGSNLKLDGAMLPDGATIGVLKSYLAARGQQDGEAVLLELLNALQGERYVDLVERAPSQRAFIFGWIRNRVLARA